MHIAERVASMDGFDCALYVNVGHFLKTKNKFHPELDPNFAPSNKQQINVILYGFNRMNTINIRMSIIQTL